MIEILIDLIPMLIQYKLRPHPNEGSFYSRGPKFCMEYFLVACYTTLQPALSVGSWSVTLLLFLSATEYHSDADYNSRRVGVVVVVVVHTFKNGHLTSPRLRRRRLSVVVLADRRLRRLWPPTAISTIPPLLILLLPSLPSLSTRRFLNFELIYSWLTKKQQ